VFENLPLSGDPIAVLISRAGVVVAGSNDVDAVNAMAAFVDAQMEEETRPISRTPLILRDGAWEPFRCGGTSLEALDNLKAKQRLRDYGEQKRLLDIHFERIGRDIFVATLSNVFHEGRIHTWATWTSEVASLLPEADAVVVARDGASKSMVRSWADVVSTCGPLNIEPGTYPHRYFVEKGPDDEAWRRLSHCPHPEWFPKLRSNV
jgi:hypothetical protein